MIYGVQPTGYVRKPLSVILAELEAAMITEFGPGVIQSPSSPFGQLNGLMADLLAEIDERNLDLYQSYDPDQAEGTRLDTLARLRLLKRGNMSDAALRQAITNNGQARIDLQDLQQAILGVEGVEFAKVFVNETGEVTEDGLERGTVAVAVLGGDDGEIARTMRRYVVPGVNTYGNTRVTTEVDGFCRSMSIIRPVSVEVELSVVVRRLNDRQGCPPPSTLAIKNSLETAWAARRVNGLDPGFYTVRSLVERAYDTVEVVSVTGARDGITYVENETVPVGFMEIAHLNATVVDA